MSLLFVYRQKKKQIAMKARKSDPSRIFSGRKCEFMLMDFKATFMFQRKEWHWIRIYIQSGPSSTCIYLCQDPWAWQRCYLCSSLCPNSCHGCDSNERYWTGVMHWQFRPLLARQKGTGSSPYHPSDEQEKSLHTNGRRKMRQKWVTVVIPRH